MADADPAPLPHHPREAIRVALVDLLKGSTDAGERVYDSRDLPLETDALPAILVYTKSERIDPDYQHEPGNRRRMMELSVEVYAAGEAGAATADAVAWQVENAIRSDHTLGNLVERTAYLNSQMDFADNGEMSVTVCAMAVEVTYWTESVLDVEGEGGGVGTIPREVLVGYAPDVGAGQEADYQTAYADEI